ncbi:MAG TPA: PspA/IM30 family protein [Planctomycetota bacterium]|nr:PspA/IM30 family protein [Planctomycetota bacterium]
MAAGFLKRVRRITMGRINAFLDGAERPEEVFPQLVQEMREECRKAIDAEAIAVAAFKRRQQEYDDLQAEIAKWGQRAELAVRDSDDALARTAIDAQMGSERRIEGHRGSLEQARMAADRAREARQDLHDKLHTLEHKRDEILARARAAKSQEAVQKVLAGVEAGSGASILDAVARMEDKVAEAEARVGAYAEVATDMAGGDAETKFRELEHKQVIETRLLELKQRIAGALPAGDADTATDKS